MMQALCLEYGKAHCAAGSAGVHRRNGLLASIVVFASLLLAACGREPPPTIPSITPATLTVEQQKILSQLNITGGHAFEERSWTYQLGGGCKLRIVSRFKGNPYRFEDVPLASVSIRVIDYSGAPGHSVMAYSVAPVARGSFDLLDTDQKARALEVAASVESLQRTCQSANTPGTGLKAPAEQWARYGGRRMMWTNQTQRLSGQSGLDGALVQPPAHRGQDRRDAGQVGDIPLLVSAKAWRA